jgi:ferredoxin-type protein NapH
MVQCSAILLMLAIPAVSRYMNFLAARELDAKIESWGDSLQGAVLSGLDTGFRALPNGEKERAGEMVRNRDQVLTYAQSVRGGTWSVQLGPLSLTDPMAGAESMAARKWAAPVLLTGIALPVLLTLLFGRIFCSWICPMHLLLECTDKLRRVLRFLELPPRDVPFSRWTKYAVLGFGLLVAAWTAVPVLAYIYPPAIIGREAHDMVFGLFDRAEAGSPGLWMGGLTWLSLVIAGIALFEVCVSRRWWCRYICPGGALYILLGAARPVRVKLKQAKCTECAECIRVCPVGLNPMHDKMGAECDNCGLCISHCGDGALDYGLAGVKKKESCEETK